MDKIQKKIEKKRERNVVSRHFHAKNDKDKIAAWKSDLVRILHVFNVRSITFVWSLLTVHFQTELAINTHATVSDTRDMVSDIHRTIVIGQERPGGANRSVSGIGTPYITG